MNELSKANGDLVLKTAGETAVLTWPARHRPGPTLSGWPTGPTRKRRHGRQLLTVYYH